MCNPSVFQEDLDVNEIAAVVFPGGSSATAYADALGEAGIEGVVKYVEKGGSLVAFCAGAYLFSRVRYFFGKQGIIGPIEAPAGQYVFSGTAYGSALGAYDMQNTGTSATAAFVRWANNEEDDFFQYWNGGPVLIRDNEAELNNNNNNNQLPEIFYLNELYEALPNEVRNAERRIAATMGRHGEGYYALFGIHPEYDITGNFLNGQLNANPNAGFWQTIQEFPRSIGLLGIQSQVSRYVLSIFLLRIGLHGGCRPE